MLKELMKLPHADLLLHINYYKIPVSITGMSDEGAKLFNKIFQYVQDNNYYAIKRTIKGGIATETPIPSYDIKYRGNSVEMTILNLEGMWRVQFRSELPYSKLSGRKAFNKFKKLLASDGIDLERYALEHNEAMKCKKEVPTPLIMLASQDYKDVVFENAHHIDFHSSFPAGLVNTHPEFERTIKRIYNMRKVDETCKAILNYSIGFMQSIDCCDARWSHLSRDAIKDNNKRLLNIALKLGKSGRKVLLFNTDGVWYQGEIYHDKTEGEDLGQWHNDHINCTFRAKSDGAYEFIEKGIYYPVVRGIPNEDKVDWKWGDIYLDKARPVIYSYIEGRGIVKDGKEI